MKKLALIIIMGLSANYIFSTSPYAPIGSNVTLNGTALQSNGQIIGVGTVDINGVNNIVVARYNTDGSVDTTFGTNGYEITLSGDSSTGAAVAIQSDGKIVVAGSSQSSGANLALVARYTTSGVLDTTFNTSGIVTTSIGTGATANSVVIQSDDKIVVAGGANFSGINQFMVARYTSSGSLDTAFDGGGSQPGVITTPINNQAVANAVALQSDGSIIASGLTEGTNTQFVSARYTTTGILDTSYGTSGISALSIGSFAISTSNAIQSDDSILLVGNSGSNNFAVARFTSTGAADSTFGTGGIVTTMLGQESQASDILVQPDGKIIAVGNSDGEVTLVRYNTDGTLDTGFGASGVVTTQVGASSSAQGVSIQSDNNIVIGGVSDNNALVARYTSTGARDVSFAIDGIGAYPRGDSLVPASFSELIFTPLSSSKDGVATTDTRFDNVYGSTPPLIALRTWLIPQSSTTQQPTTIMFNVPADFDTTWAPTIDLNLLIANNGATGSVANLRVRADFEGNNAEFGTASPANGFVQTVTSGDLTITEPTSTNLKNIRASIALDNTVINPRTVAVLVIDRVSTTGTEYANNIYLGSIVFRYKKLI